MLPISEAAPAKINLTLSVRGRRPDGYHELASIVTFADVHDVVTLEASAHGDVTVSGPFASSIAGENLLTRAFNLLREAEPRLTLGSARLEKHLPVAAGLGGGSADAAALLRAVRRVNPRFAETVPWLDIAARLGADVPVCFAAVPAIMWGIGEKTAPLQHLPTVWAVLANPGVPLSTADVFRVLETGPAREGPTPVAPDLHGIWKLVDYMHAHGNDLEVPAVHLLPVIADVKAALSAQPGSLIATMAGSGPTCFGIFADKAEADRAAEHLALVHTHWWIKSTALAGTAS